jgi:hypothetical protein
VRTDVVISLPSALDRGQDLSVLRIRPEELRDHDAVTAVVAAAFGGPAEAQLVDRIRASVPHRPALELPIPEWAPPEASQVRWLHDVDPTMTGRVVYPSAFDGLG